MIALIFTILISIVVPVIILVIFRNKNRQEMKLILGIYFLVAGFVLVTVLSFANII